MRILPIAAALSLLGALAAPAAAQPGSQPQPQPLPPGPPPELKSPGVGLGLAVAGSIIPAIGFGIGLSIDDNDVASDVVILSLLGGLILPSTGMYYAGKKKTIGAYPRAAALLTLGLAALFDGLGEDGEAGDWYAASGALYGLGCVIDIAMTPAAVREYNARKAAAPPMVVAPTLVPGGAGLALTGQF